MNGEEEDTDVGFPGPGHFIAEREWPMKIAMSVLAFGAIVGGLIQIPGVDSGIEHFLDPTFADSSLYALAGIDPLGLGRADHRGRDRGHRASRSPTGSGSARPGRRRALQTRFAAIHTLLANKWYFDELIDFVVVRPALWFGRFAEVGARADRDRRHDHRRDRGRRPAPARRPCAASRPASCATTPPR